MKKTPRRYERRQIRLPGVAGEPLGEWVLLPHTSLETIEISYVELQSMLGVELCSILASCRIVAVALPASLAAACALAIPATVVDSC